MRLSEFGENSSLFLSLYCIARSCHSLSLGKARDTTFFMAMSVFFAFQFYLINTLSHKPQSLSEREVSVESPSLRGSPLPPSNFLGISEMKF